MNKKVVLVVMDGVGISDKEYGNAVAAAYKPTLDKGSRNGGRTSDRGRYGKKRGRT